jgi:phosphoenolpyruvate synthase/pyruvate phosphate dikinase
VPLVGGKNASLGEMLRELKSKGVRVPDGFAVTAEAHREFLRTTGLDKKIRELLKGLDANNAENLQQRGRAVREAILREEIPKGIRDEIFAAYGRLSEGRAGGIDVAVRSDLASAGVMFSIDTESGFKDAVLINAAWGLGENVVQGTVNPDEFYVFKPTLALGYRPILQKKVGSKEFKLIYDSGGGKLVKNIPVSEAERSAFCINDDDILTLARWAVTIEEHYTKKKGSPCPIDMEWAKDGITGELFIVQARPETVQSQRDVTRLEVYGLQEKGKVLVEGRSVGERIASGTMRVVKSAANLSLVKQGDVLVTDRTDPDWEPAMKKAAAIVTNHGGRTCHAAIVSRAWASRSRWHARRHRKTQRR